MVGSQNFDVLKKLILLLLVGLSTSEKLSNSLPLLGVQLPISFDVVVFSGFLASYLFSGLFCVSIGLLVYTLLSSG